jgi:hypothetical protein
MLIPMTRWSPIFRSPAAGESAGAGGAAPETPAEVQAGEEGAETPAGKAAGKEARAGEKPAQEPAKRDGKGRFSPAPTPDQDDTAFHALVAKATKDTSYQMTDQEAELFERVNNRPDGPPKEPKKPKVKEPELDEEEEEPEAADEKAPKGKDAPPEDEEDDTPTPKALKALVGKESPIGAKSVAEIPEKVRGLVEQLKKAEGMGGKLEQANKRLQNLDAFVRDFVAQKPDALEFAEKHFGFKPTGHAPAARPGQKPAVGQNGKPKPVFLDDDMAAYVADLEGKVTAFEGRFAKLEQTHRKSEEISAAAEAQSGVINEMSTLVEKYAELRPATGSVRELMKEYFADLPKGANIDSRIKNLVEVLKIAARDELPTLQHAYAAWKLETHPQTVIEAERRGRQSLANTTPSRGLSDRQGSQGGQYQAYTDEDFESMKNGAMPVPDDWLDADGNIVPTRLPKRFRDKYAADFAEFQGQD